MLFIWCEDLSRLCRGTLHKSIIISLVPCNTILSTLFTARVFWLKLALHPSSYNLPINMRELYASTGKMWDSISLSGSDYKDSQHPLVDCRIWPFGCFAIFGYVCHSAMLFG